MNVKPQNIRRRLASCCVSVVMALSAIACGAEQDAEPIPDEEAALSVEQAISDQCKTASPDQFVSVLQDCSGCTPGTGRYIVASGNNYQGPPCQGNHILTLGGNQQTISFRTFWDDAVPTTQATCTAAKITQQLHYRGSDIGAPLVRTGTWSNGRCTPPSMSRTHTHVIQSGLPGEFFAHLRVLTDAQTAITHGKRFGVHICRGLNGCN